MASEPAPPSPRPRDRLSAAQARRVALAALGFADPAPPGVPTRRHLRRVLDRVRLLQMDSVNVLVRAHYLPLYSRLGPYPPGLLDAAAYGRGRELFEYWGHEASLLPLASHRLLRWRMARAAAGEGTWGRVARIAREQPELVAAVLAALAERGAATAAELADERPRRTGPWWEWHAAKTALEHLLWAGRVSTAGRRGFERVYDLTERVLPPGVLAEPTPEPADAQRELVRQAAAALGVATEADLRDYFRLDVAEARARVGELVAAGELVPVTVAGWPRPGYLWHRARLPRRVSAATLVSPFDPLVWRRERAERLFGFRYRIEIYVPAHRRVHGYYVLPFLLGDRLVARVDLKADRAAGRLLVRSAWAEAPAGVGEVGEVVAALAGELVRLAGWLGLDRVLVEPAGDLWRPLAAVVVAVHG